MPHPTGLQRSMSLVAKARTETLKSMYTALTVNVSGEVGLLVEDDLEGWVGALTTTSLGGTVEGMGIEGIPTLTTEIVVEPKYKFLW